MKRRVIKLTACCIAGAVALSGNGLITMAAGCDLPLAGLESRIQEQQQKKDAAGPILVEATGFDTVAIAQVNEYVNIRDEASAEEGQVLGKLYNNSAATILAKEDDWYLIKSGSVIGYVKSEYFITGNQAEELAKEVGNEIATVNTTTLMVRSEAGTDSEVLALVGDSEDLRVQEDMGDWVKVAVDSDIVGYVSKDYVECRTEFVEAESIEEESARIAAEEAAYLAALEEARLADEAAAAAAEQAYIEAMEREAAAAQAEADAAAQEAEDTQTPEDTQAAAEAQAEADAAAQAAADAAAQAAADAAAAQAAADEAAQQETQADTSSSEESSPDTSSSSTASGLRQSIVNFALQFVGNPYVWGGTSLTNGADCSGFTQSVMANFGISIPRVAASQAGSGRAVNLSDIQPGDLLFYSGSGGIGHVTMYIGNGQVVHASNSQTGIIVSNMSYRTPCSARSYID